MQVILFEDPQTGRASVFYPTHEGYKMGMEALAAQVVPAGSRSRVVDDSEIPKDREFRDAWVIAEDAIAVDLSQARVIKADKLRKEREPLLAALDVDYLRAMEAGDDKSLATIASKKQALRDAPALVESAASVEDLKSIELP